MIVNVSIRQTNTSLKVDMNGKRVAFKERLTQKRAEYKNAIDQLKPHRDNK